MPHLTAIVLADRIGQELYPITQQTPPALLPVATKPVLEHVLDALSGIGVKHIVLIVSTHAEQIAARIGKGERWQVQLEYVLSMGEELPSHILDRLGRRLTEHEYILVRGDVIFSFDLAAFIKQTLIDTRHLSVFATLNGQCAGIGLLRRQTQLQQAHVNPWLASNALQWRADILQNKFTQHIKNLPSTTLLAVKGDVSLIESLTAYHTVNLACWKQGFQHLLLPLKQRYAHRYAQQWIGRNANIPQHLEGIYGAYCRVHRTAQVQASVLSDNVFIDRYTTIHNSVILPNTYVGEKLSLQQAIVSGNTLIRIDSSAVIQTKDTVLLANLQLPQFRTLLYVSLQRGLAASLLLLSFPLWGIAASWAIIRTPDRPLVKLTVHNHFKVMSETGTWQPRTFTTWEWQLPSPILQHLPKLWAVVQGHMRLIGVSAETPAQACKRTLAWEKQRDLAPVGLLGPAQLSLPATVLPEERLLLEGYYARTRTVWQDAVWVWWGAVALFKRSTWKS